MTVRSASQDLREGILGDNPSVTVTFDLWVNSGHFSSTTLPEQSVDLIAGAPITGLTYDTEVITADPIDSADRFALRRYTITQTDPTAKPQWASVIMTLSGYRAPWTILGANDAEVDGIFVVRAAGFDTLHRAVINDYPNYGLSTTVTDPVYTQLAGGVSPASTATPYVFAHSGGLLLKVRTAFTHQHPIDWSAIRLFLYDPKDELTPSRIKAHHHPSQSDAIAGRNPTHATAVRLSPASDGYRHVDIEFAAIFNDNTTDWVVIEAPILKYLRAFQKTTPVKDYSLDSNEIFEAYYDPTSSSTTGFTANNLVLMSDRGIVTEWHVWSGSNHITTADPTDTGGAETRLDIAWGVPDDTLPAVYTYLPHAIRNVDISVIGSGSLAPGPQTRRAHFS